MIIWTDFKPHLAQLIAAFPQHQISTDVPLAKADVAFGQPDPKTVIASPKLKWVHVTSAGYTKYDTPAFFDALRARGAAFTNSSSVFDEPCAQHLLSMMLAFSRQLPTSWENQRADRNWAKGGFRKNTFLLRGQTTIIYGVGAIGRRLTEMLQPFDMTIYGVRRKPSGPNQFTPEQADAILPRADHVVNTLPASPSTNRFFTAERLAKIKPSAFFYNIGRGTTVDQAALLAMLMAGQIRGAYLDVTDPEPLPPDSPLWSAPNCCITPHTGGGHANEDERVSAHFADNLRRFTQAQPLLDRVV
jgi:phosphoglycerate dehydrogenase-like enzyme